MDQLHNEWEEDDPRGGYVPTRTKLNKKSKPKEPQKPHVPRWPLDWTHTCPYCGADLKLEDSAVVYDGKSYGDIWMCKNYPECNAYVGCHNGTAVPKGFPANKKLRVARIHAHHMFDPMWKGENKVFKSRHSAYAWMRDVMRLTKDRAHIAMLTVFQCMILVEKIKEKREEINEHR